MILLDIAKLRWRRRTSEQVLPSRDSATADIDSDIVLSLSERRTPLRVLYDEIGRFLFANKLDLTPLNFGCTHDYLSGSDKSIVAAFDKASCNGLISNGWIENYVATHQSSVVTPAAIEAMVKSIETELNACLTMIGVSAEQTEMYGNALNDCATDVPSDVFTQRLITLTRRMIAQTRLTEAEMRACHARMHDLQTTLRAARRASKTDPLTGLQNRRGFERCVSEALAHAKTRSNVIAICDLDHFKAVNDRFGHETGDRVLCYFAQELNKLGTAERKVARLGGEEFGILFVGDTLESAAETIHKVRQTLAGRTLRDQQTDEPIGAITFSGGLAVLSVAGGLSAALREADAAMYAAKRNGRNQLYAAYGRGNLASL